MAERGFATGRHAQKINVEYDRREKDMREVYKMLGITVKGPWRSYKTVDPEMVINLARQHTTNTNIATIVGVSVDTLMKHFTDEIAIGRALGECFLSAQQYETIKEKQPSMLQWLGRAWLKQNADSNEATNHRDEVVEFIKILRDGDKDSKTK
jgi:hypothetical protein